MVHQSKFNMFIRTTTTASARRALVKLSTTSRSSDRKTLIELLETTWEAVLLMLKNETKETLVKTAAEFGITLLRPKRRLRW